MGEFPQGSDETVLLDLTPEEVTLVFYLLGLASAKSLTINEINVLANGLFLTAQVMFVISAQRTLINDVVKEVKEAAEKDKQEKEDKKKEKQEKDIIEKMESNIRSFQKQIELMQKQLNELKRNC